MESPLQQVPQSVYSRELSPKITAETQVDTIDSNKIEQQLSSILGLTADVSIVNKFGEGLIYDINRVVKTFASLDITELETILRSQCYLPGFMDKHSLVSGMSNREVFSKLSFIINDVFNELETERNRKANIKSRLPKEPTSVFGRMRHKLNTMLASNEITAMENLHTLVRFMDQIKDGTFSDIELDERTKNQLEIEDKYRQKSLRLKKDLFTSGGVRMLVAMVDMPNKVSMEGKQAETPLETYNRHYGLIINVFESLKQTLSTIRNKDGIIEDIAKLKVESDILELMTLYLQTGVSYELLKLRGGNVNGISNPRNLMSDIIESIRNVTLHMDNQDTGLSNYLSAYSDLAYTTIQELSRSEYARSFPKNSLPGEDALVNGFLQNLDSLMDLVRITLDKGQSPDIAEQTNMQASSRDNLERLYQQPPSSSVTEYDNTPVPLGF